jgi:radical SAM protein with 4Fe4S-binding SPASM domain
VNKFFWQISALDYFNRHFHSIYPYLTVRKIVNVLYNYLEFKFKVASLQSFPPFIKIEPTALCHLRCPGCRHADPDYNNQLKPRMRISFDDVKKTIDPLAKHLIGVSLSNHGEPLLHKELARLIHYIHEQNVAVTFPSNLSVIMSDDDIDNLILSGADTIFVSLDGASEETYIKYRVGGKFELVKSNVQRLQAAKQRLKLKRPRLVWKFVIFEHNEHEVDIVRNTFQTIGFDSYEMVMDRRSSSYKSKKKHMRMKVTAGASTKAIPKPCFWPWHTMMIDWNGEVSPCCTHQDFDLGNAIETNSAEIWKSEKYRELRAGFSDIEHLNPICQRCLGLTSYDASPSKLRSVTNPPVVVMLKNEDKSVPVYDEHP